MSLRTTIAKEIREYYLELEELIKEYKKYNLEQKLLNSNNINEFLTIDKFILKNNYNIFENDIFYELWEQLYNKKEILITENLLNFLYKFDEKNMHGKTVHVNNRLLKQHFIEFLKDNLIEYQQIDIHSEKIKLYEYIQNDIKNSDSRTIHLKRWIILTIDNFKEVAMIKSSVVRRYYLTLEKILFHYCNYTSEYNIQREKIIRAHELNQLTQSFQTQLQIKSQELEKAKSERTKYKQLLHKTVKLKKTQYIYITTTKLYAKNNYFKVGGSLNKSTIKSRLSTYNSGKAPEDIFYYAYLRQCHDYRSTEQQFNLLFGNHRLEKNKELYNLHFSDIVRYLDLIIDNDSNLVDKVNEERDLIYANVINLTPLIPSSIEIKETITTEFIQDGNRIIVEKQYLDDLSDEEFKSLIENYYNNLKDKSKIKRKDFEQNLEVSGYIIKKKKTVWDKTKDLISSLDQVVKLIY